MKYFSIQTRGAYKCNMFCSAFRSQLRDGLLNYFFENSFRVSNGKFHSATNGWLLLIPGFIVTGRGKILLADVTDDCVFSTGILDLSSRRYVTFNHKWIHFDWLILTLFYAQRLGPTLHLAAIMPFLHLDFGPLYLSRVFEGFVCFCFFFFNDQSTFIGYFMLNSFLKNSCDTI